jgi:hypothetical protein
MVLSLSASSIRAAWYGKASLTYQASSGSLVASFDRVVPAHRRKQLTEDFVMSSPQGLDQPGALTISSVLQPVDAPGHLRSTPDPSGTATGTHRYAVTRWSTPGRRRRNSGPVGVGGPIGAKSTSGIPRLGHPASPRRRAEAACPVPSELTRSTRSGSRVRNHPPTISRPCNNPPDLGCGIEPRRGSAALTCCAPAMGPRAEQQIWRLRCY